MAFFLIQSGVCMALFMSCKIHSYMQVNIKTMCLALYSGFYGRLADKQICKFVKVAVVKIFDSLFVHQIYSIITEVQMHFRWFLSSSTL